MQGNVGGLILGVICFAAWSMGMGSFLYFRIRVAPSALQRWADEEGYKILRRKNGGFFEWWSIADASGYWVYRVVVQDRTGQSREALVRVGAGLWFSMSVSTCPVKVQWKDAKALNPATSYPSKKGRLMDRDLD